MEFVPEYAGSALEFVAGAGSASPDETETHRELARALAARGIAVLAAAPAEDQNGFAVTSITAGGSGSERSAIKTLLGVIASALMDTCSRLPT